MDFKITSLDKPRESILRKVELAPKGIPWVMKWIILGLFILGACCPDREIALYAALVFWIIAKLLWRTGQPQTLFFIAIFQWFQCYGAVLQGLIEDKPYWEISAMPSMETSLWLSLTGVLVLAVGFKLATFRSEPINSLPTVKRLLRMDGKRLLLLWVMASMAALGVRFGGALYVPIVQAFAAVEIWKWAMVMMVFYRWMATGQGLWLSIGILVFETAIGMLGIFSSFKTVFFLLIIASMGMLSVSHRRGIFMTVCSVILVFIFGFWQVVKGYYRSFMSGGEKAQVVTVSVSERVNWMGQAIQAVGFEHLQQGWEDGLRRLSYVDFFGYAIKTVPGAIKHTDGLLWQEAIAHTLQPRFLFPNKAAIDDSLRTNTYCGVSVTGEESGTSISIGYMGESYIDFGEVGMFVPIFLWGLMLGATYHWLRKEPSKAILGISMGAGMLMNVGLLLETSNIKMLGGLIVAYVGLYLTLKLFGRLSWYFVIAGDKRSRFMLRGVDMIRKRG